MPKKRRCKKCGADISHRHGRAVYCVEHRSNDVYSLGKTCLACAAPITNNATYCQSHAHPSPDTERNNEIVQYYLDGEKCAHLAREYGIGRERVRQIIVAADATPPRKQKMTCLTCGKETVGGNYCNHKCRTFRSRCVICGSPCSETRCKKHAKQNPWVINQAVTLYESGLSQKQVMEAMGTSMLSVSRHLKIAGKGPGKGNGHRTSPYFLTNRPESP